MSSTLTDSMRFRTGPTIAGIEEKKSRGCPQWSCPAAGLVAVPASLVYLVYPVSRAEDSFAPATSNGLAGGPSLSAAILSGLSELIESATL